MMRAIDPLAGSQKAKVVTRHIEIVRNERLEKIYFPLLPHL